MYLYMIAAAYEGIHVYCEEVTEPRIKNYLFPVMIRKYLNTRFLQGLIKEWVFEHVLCSSFTAPNHLQEHF